ncbi:MAG: glycogen debranching N-terminal domain-containing protein [Nitrososphaerota archaeon]
MPVEINVGPPVLTINQGSTFMVTDLNGDITVDSEQGVYAGDTRFVSRYAIYANGLPWSRLTSSTTAYYAMQLYLANPAIPTETGEIPAGTLALIVNRTVSDGLHEDIDIENHALVPVRFNLEVLLRADFADIFEVKAHRFVRRGRIVTDWDDMKSELRTSYTDHDFRRELIYGLLNGDIKPHYANGRVTWEVAIEPGHTFHTCCYYTLIQEKRVRKPLYGCYHDPRSQSGRMDRLQLQWRHSVPRMTTPNEDVYRFYRQSVEDLGALRLYDHDFKREVWLPAAGVPWFVTIFGRDSLIVSLQSLWIHRGLALGALKKLAELQATERDDWRDAQPGKMPHEARFGELAHFHLIPHTPYYGTADATILYLILLHEAWRWLGEDTLLREYRDTALRCLEWIDHYGDLDGDGFQEYQTFSTKGYENMGWKDASDAVVYPDGSQVKQPKALCELQGYVFDAWLRMAEVFDALGEGERARTLRRKAEDLRARFWERFWVEDAGIYAYALDSAKRPVRTVASNMGHCLWSGIAAPEHAARIAERLQQPDMWSGWGIRTLSASNPVYNPFSYQLGSVWPHDNGIIAQGFARYGLHDAAARVARDISEAASFFASYRLPELYAGIARQQGTFPVQYLGANVPQAWAAGSVFHLLQAILGLRADAPHGRVYVDPHLPHWLSDITLEGIKAGDGEMDLRFWREGEESCWEVQSQRGNLTVSQEPWRPWGAPASEASVESGSPEQGVGPASARATR